MVTMDKSGGCRTANFPALDRKELAVLEEKPDDEDGVLVSSKPLC